MHACMVIENRNFKFKFKYWAGSTADVPRGIAQKFAIIIIIIIA